MKILVTGTAGFIGFHLAKSLLSDSNVDVVGLDNFNDYYSVQLKRDRHAVLEEYGNFTAVECDLCDLDRVKTVFEDHQFDYVCNLAAQAGVRYSLDNPLSYQRSNVQGFLNILEACRGSKVPRLVYASSSSVYGGNTKLPFSESDRVDNPLNLYAASKKANELMAHAYTHLYGIQTIGLRFFTVYGPWGRPDMAMWLFTKAMFEGRPIKVFNHGKMRRDFTYIEDIIQGVRASIFGQDLDNFEVFNLGNHKSENLLEMIEILAKEVGVGLKTEMLPMQPGDVEATWADIDRAELKLGFKPTTSISDGIPQFVQWYRDYHNC